MEDRLKLSLTKYYHGELGLPDYECHINKRIHFNEDNILTLIKRIEQYTDSLKGKDILSVGSGWGEFAITLANYGANVIGIEPNNERVEISNLRSKGICKFYIGIAEEVPFDNCTFDFVECSSVLEHVKDPKRVISEMIRVLKIGGFCYVQCPNYFYLTESHYKILWFPFMPKVIARFYLKLRGRNPNFINHINYTTPFMLKTILKEYTNIQMKDISGLPFLPSTNIKRKMWNCLVRFYNTINIAGSPIELVIEKVEDGEGKYHYKRRRKDGT